MRPPGRPSSTTVSPDAVLTLWLTGHQRPICAVHTRKACAGAQSISIDTRRGSIIVLRYVLGEESKAVGGFPPHPRQVLLHGGDALVMQPVDAPGALWLLDHQAGVAQQPQVPGDGRPADRQRVGDLPDRALPAAEQFDDRPALRVAERLERVGGGIDRGHDGTVLAAG